MSAGAGRLAAARSLLAVEEGAHVEDALAELAPAAGPDRDQAWFLAYGVLRRRGHVDAALRPVLTRPLAALDPPVRAALRIGTYERLYARTPAHAAVDQAVDVAAAIGAGKARGLVNAVVRRVRQAERLTRSEALDLPAWLVDRWDRRYGPAATEAWAAACGEPPPLFVVRNREGTLPEGAVATSVPAVFRVEGGVVPMLAGFVEGGWWVQDLAAVRVADLVGARPGERVLDACAAPGGKAFRLGTYGAEVVAVDRDRARLGHVAEGAERFGLRIHTRVHDWSKGPLGEVFDAVLVDAPCTGLGTVRRHPEIRWRRSEEDLPRAAGLQRRILDAASASVRPGGRLVYAVCSPEPEEGEDVVAAFVAEHPRFEVEERLATVPPVEGEDAHVAVRLRRAR